MIQKDLINALKPFKVSIMGKEHIAKVFPNLLANACRSMCITDIYGNNQPIVQDEKKFLEFKNNLGVAIYTDNYSTIDNIIINFFKTYNYKTITPVNQLVMFKVNFTNEAEEKFKEVCNNFKGKDWDNIIDYFIDALYDFLSSATVHGDRFIEWR